MRADVKGDKRSLCVEHARRDGRAELVCGGGGEGVEGVERVRKRASIADGGVVVLL